MLRAMADGDNGESKAFKDWFDREAARALGAQVAATCPGFDERRFFRRATEDLDALEMMDRVRQFSAALRAELPEDMERGLRMLADSLPPLLDGTENVTGGYLQWPIGQLIADHGVAHLDASWHAMIELTQRLTSEFAIRPFVERYPDEVFARLLALTSHESPHVRRWCSEGVRPRLPWGKRLDSLIADPSPIFPILERLKDDPSLYVRKSVANCLNDVAKDHPETVLEIAARWMDGASEERAWVVKHALRTLIKAGDPRALEVLGYGPPKGLTATLSVSPETVAIGEHVSLSLVLENAGPDAELLIDYRVHYRKSSGDARPKVFKWKTLSLKAGESASLTKKQPMRVTTIRPLYPGAHAVDVQINGVVLAASGFTLRDGEKPRRR